MDLVDYREETFARIREDYLTAQHRTVAGRSGYSLCPLSEALEGDNVAAQSANALVQRSDAAGSHRKR